MRIVPTLAAVAFLVATPPVTYAQSSGADHNAHHSDKAQAAPESPRGSMMCSGMMKDGKMSGGMMGGGAKTDGTLGNAPLPHVEGRLAFLKAELKITAAQEPQWTKFADAVRAMAKNADEAARARTKGGGMRTPTTQDIIGRSEKALTTRLEAVRVVGSAFEPLYASFSDEQKKAADELLVGPMGIM